MYVYNLYIIVNVFIVEVQNSHFSLTIVKNLEGVGYLALLCSSEKVYVRVGVKKRIGSDFFWIFFFKRRHV